MVTASDPWPGDPAFQSLARKVRDAVMLAERQGHVITTTRFPNCCCPLGAVLLLNGSPRPPSHPSASFVLHRWRGKNSDREAVVPDERMIWAFIAGFEEGVESRSCNYAIKAAGLLGVVYRKRFLKLRAQRFDPRPRRQRLNLTKPPARR